jgi:hypothetical protein
MVVVMKKEAVMVVVVMKKEAVMVVVVMKKEAVMVVVVNLMMEERKSRIRVG